MSGRVRLVGLTTYRQQAKWASWDRPAAVVNASYVDCVATAGGRPVLLPPSEGEGASEESESEVARALDALVVIGGADVDPSRYGTERGVHTQATQPWRDENELRLMSAFIAEGKPVLGICRGAQILNTLLGGTLLQHLPDVTGSTKHQPAPGVFGDTEVRAEPGTQVAKAMGDAFVVKCCHHQAVDKLGEGLRVAARSSDGVVEAVECDFGFVVGAQWHPEEAGDTRLFRALVEAC